jgi:hypothetical protein
MARYRWLLSNYQQARFGLVLHNILTGEARQFSDLEKQIEQLGQKCLEAFTVNVR